MDKRALLKIKIKSLAEESRIIRREENQKRMERRCARAYRVATIIERDKRLVTTGIPEKTPEELVSEASLSDSQERHAERMRVEMHEHRVKYVRRPARSALLAYGFLRGTPYEKIEGKPRTKPLWKTIEALVEEYGVCRDHENETGRAFASRSQLQYDLFKRWKPKEEKKSKKEVVSSADRS